MELKHGLAAAFGPIWMMRPSAFDAMCGLLNSPFVRSMMEQGETPDRGLMWLAGGKSRQTKAVAVVSISGVIDQKRTWMMDYMGGTSTDETSAIIDSLVADPNVKGIILDVDSPGGTALGLRTLSDKIFNARGAKPIVSVSNSEMNSAAYWAGSSASKVFVDPGSQTGSVGVWSAAAEYTKQMEQDGVTIHVTRSAGSPHKAEWLPFQQFSEEAKAHEQVEVDNLYGEFVSYVARNRGVSAATVRSDFGKGRSMNAKDAIAAGLADRVATLEDVARRMDSGRLTVGVLNDPRALAAAFAEELPPDESWRDLNETAKLRSRLRMKGVVA